MAIVCPQADRAHWCQGRPCPHSSWEPRPVVSAATFGDLHFLPVLPLRAMDVHQAPHLRCPSRPQVRCLQTRPQTHSHWRLGTRSETGLDTALSQVSIQGSPSYFQPQAGHVTNTNIIHKDICWTSPLTLSRRRAFMCRGFYINTCTDKTQI